MFLEVGGTPGHEVEEFLAEHIDVIFRSHFEYFGVELFDQIDVLVIDAGCQVLHKYVELLGSGWRLRWVF